MAGTISYNRAKDPAINATGMLYTILVSEKPDAVSAIGGTGTTGILDAEFQVDADESGGADVQAHGKFTITPAVDSNGVTKYTVVFTPILGAGGDGKIVTTVLTHDENMDAWQIAAGRPRQV